MHRYHRQPARLFTTHLAICSIAVSHSCSYVRLFGVYGNLLDGGFPGIEIETEFDTFYELLDLLDEDQEETVDRLQEDLAAVIACPTSTMTILNPDEDYAALYFMNHIFALELNCERDEEGRAMATEETAYRLIGYTERGNIPDFLDWFPPGRQDRQTHHYLRALAVQYHLYLSFEKRMEKGDALVATHLAHPLLFNLAKAQYEELEKVGWGGETMC